MSELDEAREGTGLPREVQDAAIEALGTRRLCDGWRGEVCGATLASFWYTCRLKKRYLGGKCPGSDAIEAAIREAREQCLR